MDASFSVNDVFINSTHSTPTAVDGNLESHQISSRFYKTIYVNGNLFYYGK